MAALRSEVMKRLASSFFLGDPMVGKYFLQLLGDGDNGKSTLFLILHAAFPTWVKMPDVEHLLMHGRKSDANAPQEWKMQIMGARIVVFEEPPGDAIFDGKLLCKLRGGGFVTGRNLYQNNVSYKPTYRLVIGCNAPMEIKPMDKAVLRSIHVFTMPSAFVDAGDPRLGPPPQPNVFLKIDQVHERFEQRAYKIALFRILVEDYQEYQAHPLSVSLQSAYDRRDLYEEADAKTDLEWFDEHFDVLTVDDPTQRLTTRDIRATLTAAGYQASEKHLGGWMAQHFQVRRIDRRTRAFGHASVRQVNHGGTWHWVCIAPKPGAAGQG